MKKIIGLVLFCICISTNAISFAEGLPDITSYFGWRIHPIYGDYRFHSGVDFAMDINTPVYSLFNGTVVSSENFDDGYGNQVMIYHEEYDTYTRYAHLNVINVVAGQYVYAGTLIGLSGATGNVTGAHLHLEYIIPDGNGGYTYTDPLSLYGI